ncbi:hypothetical protein WV31_05450 [Magnetospirillum sp. ME-1]|uniref:hypothetical protein n=1 Tax=Magnetospirillum sp. ME-1 TaxID=1639348 RepID=UPI000A17BC04|nr:hypothetical protein [Magnetospirillum sp. ME-1]ARJ65143.1 hypothetical protein WV31_05450 [Magnetospirillum sp. ME-1]
MPVKIAAPYAGISDSSIWEMIKDGKLETVLFAGRRLVLRESLDKLIAEARKAPPVKRRSPNPRARKAS